MHTTITNKEGKPEVVSDYATVQGILIGVVAAFVLVITVIGPENYGSHFENAKTAFEEGGGSDEVARAAGAGAEGSEGSDGGEKGSRPTSVQSVQEKV